jgi:hypothetical protein
MARRLVVYSLTALGLALAGLGAYSLLWPEPAPPAVVPPEFVAPVTPLPETDRFADLAGTDPVGMFEACLARYAKDAKGFRATLEKQERVAGKLHDREVVRVVGWGEVPATPGEEPDVHVRMIWEQGAQKDFFGNTVRGTVFPAGETDKTHILTYRPGALLSEHAIGVKESLARGASRYCIKDSGLYRGMLRTYAAWKARRDAGELVTEYRGKERVEKAGGRECHVVRRLCPHPEADSFALDEKAPTDPRVIERDGFTQVTVMIDAERWLQVGTRLENANGDLIGEYYFRDVELVTEPFPAGTFTGAALRAEKK